MMKKNKNREELKTTDSDKRVPPVEKTGKHEIPFKFFLSSVFSREEKNS